MVLALAATALVALALLSDLILPRVDTLLAQHKARRRRIPTTAYDPGRERRAEQRARELLRSCVGEEEWGMYRDLGFVRVWGSQTETPAGGADGVPYAYLVYPHKPLIAYLPQTNRLLAEYCVEFPDVTRPYGSARLPDSDDVLAKWMALTGDERRLVSTANMHLPGRQHDPRRVARDLWRLAQWERARMRTVRPAGESRIDAAG
jgi:hypothetical protein